MEIGGWQFVVVTGLVIGVASGMTTAILLGNFAWARRRLERREQVRFIRGYRSCPGAWCKSVALYAAPGG